MLCNKNIIRKITGREASIALLSNAAPSMTSLSTSASTATAAADSSSTLRLKGAAHIIAIDSTGEPKGHGTPLYLHAKRYALSSNASGHRRRSARVLKR